MCHHLWVCYHPQVQCREPCHLHLTKPVLGKAMARIENSPVTDLFMCQKGENRISIQLQVPLSQVVLEECFCGSFDES